MNGSFSSQIAILDDSVALPISGNVDLLFAFQERSCKNLCTSLWIDQLHQSVLVEVVFPPVNRSAARLERWVTSWKVVASLL